MRLKLTLKILLLIPFMSFAQESIQQTDTAGYKNYKPEINAQKINSGKIKVDGILNEPEWNLSQVAGNFVEVEPGDNILPSVSTETRILYDDDNLYISFTCFDPEMNKLRVSMSDRDKIFSDDFIGFILDTYKDEKQGYEIFFNANGIQADGIWTPNDENFSFDMVFESEGKIYHDKWIVEVSIPFFNLRFPYKKEQEWKVHFLRIRPRETRQQISWAVIDRNNPELLTQAGLIKGIKDIRSRKKLELLPYVIGSHTGSLNDPEDPSSDFVNNKFKGDFGVGLKYGFSSNLTGELVYNPDFSQVESDATQIDVNNSSALFYPEKRPFFLEGANIFEQRQNTVYTRMLNSPYFAAKLTGKVSGLDIGFLSSYDRNTSFIVPYDYGSDLVFADSLKSFAGILRLKKSLKGESFLGLMLTSREMDKAYNRVISFDGSYSFLKNYFIKWQAMYFQTKEPDRVDIYENFGKFGDKNYTLGFDGESFSGFGGVIGFERRSSSWNMGLNYSELPPETRKDLGYTGSVNFRELYTWHNYSFYPKKSIVVRGEANLNAGLRFNFNGRLKEQWIIPNIFLQFKNLINIGGGFLLVNNELYEGVFHKNVQRGWVNVNINTSKILNGGMFIEVGRYIVRFEEPSYVGFGFSGEAWMSFQPTDKLLIENTYNYYEISDKFEGNKLYSGYVFRNKSSFQFTKNIFLRLILQYDSFSKRFDVLPLFSYKWNPFTIFYIGSKHEIKDFGESGSHDRYKETDRQFFAKFQYLFSL